MGPSARIVDFEIFLRERLRYYTNIYTFRVLLISLLLACAVRYRNFRCGMACPQSKTVKATRATVLIVSRYAPAAADRAASASL